jgi:hypothetical protein
MWGSDLLTTVDHVGFLQDAINKALANYQHLLVVFLDSEKALNRIWHVSLCLSFCNIERKG